MRRHLAPSLCAGDRDEPDTGGGAGTRLGVCDGGHARTCPGRVGVGAYLGGGGAPTPGLGGGGYRWVWGAHLGVPVVGVSG